MIPNVIFLILSFASLSMPMAFQKAVSYTHLYIEFSKKYFDYTKRIGKEQYLVPYLMSSHPGATLKDAVKLA